MVEHSYPITDPSLCFLRKLGQYRSEDNFVCFQCRVGRGCRLDCHGRIDIQPKPWHYHIDVQPGSNNIQHCDSSHDFQSCCFYCRRREDQAVGMRCRHRCAWCRSYLALSQGNVSIMLGRGCGTCCMRVCLNDRSLIERLCP